jgi:hypothetical protein
MEEAVGVVLALLRAAFWPAVVALAIVLVAPRISPRRFALAWWLIAAFVVAYAVGHALAAGPDWRLWPARNWHWMFYLVPLAGLVGVISTSNNASSTNRCLMMASFAILAAGLLTSRPTLWAPRATSGLMLFAYFTFAWSALAPIERRTSPAALAGSFALASAALSLMISEHISLSDGAIIVAAAAALAIIAIAAWLARRAEPAAGLAVPFAIALGGWAWIETLSEARLWPVLLIPLAPLALWTAQSGPLSRLRRPAALGVQFAAVLSVIVLAGVLLRVVAAE